MVIQLKRFESGREIKKIRGHVGYEKVMTVGQRRYTLTGVIVHWGGHSEHGHYIAVVWREGCWYYCNDRSVTRCEERVAMG